MDNLVIFINILAQQNGWTWLILAAVLFVLDLLAPGFFFLWFGFAAAAVGALLFAWPMSVTWQIALFSVASVISLFIGRATWGSHRVVESDSPLLNRRAQQLVGQIFVLAEAISSGRGRIIAGDSLWTVIGPDMPAGQRVRVTGVNGTMLVVERAA